MRRFVVLVLIAAVTVGCRPTPDQNDAGSDKSKLVAALSGVQEKLKQKGSARTEMVTTTKQNFQGQGREVRIRATGGFDYARNVGTMTMDFREPYAAMGPNAPYEELVYVYEGTIAYIKIPPKSRSKAPGKQWVKVSMQELSGGAVASGEVGGGGDPSANLRYFKDVSASEIETLGKEEVRGEPTTHYRVNVRLAKMFEQVPEPERTQMIQSMNDMGITGAVPMEVWLDGEGIARRFKMTLKAQDGKFETTTTVETFDLGAALEISVPAEAETVTLSSRDELAGYLGGG